MWVTVGKSEDLPPGTARSIRAGRRRIALVRTWDGELHALSDTCPHRGARLGTGRLCRMVKSEGPGSYRLGDTIVLRCPWHGYEFDVTCGDSVIREPKLHVAIFPTKEEAGEMCVDI
jgi:nitrite reductase/ring-hydroxylating ferredoxin subunit